MQNIQDKKYNLAAELTLGNISKAAEYIDGSNMLEDEQEPRVVCVDNSVRRELDLTKQLLPACSSLDLIKKLSPASERLASRIEALDHIVFSVNSTHSVDHVVAASTVNAQDVASVQDAASTHSVNHTVAASITSVQDTTGTQDTTGIQDATGAKNVANTQDVADNYKWQHENRSNQATHVASGDLTMRGLDIALQNSNKAWFDIVTDMDKSDAAGLSYNASAIDVSHNAATADAKYNDFAAGRAYSEVIENRNNLANRTSITSKYNIETDHDVAIENNTSNKNNLEQRLAVKIDKIGQFTQQQGMYLAEVSKTFAQEVETLVACYKQDKIKLASELRLQQEVNKQLAANHADACAQREQLRQQIKSLEALKISSDTIVQEHVGKIAHLESIVTQEQELRNQADKRTQIAIQKARQYAALKKIEEKRRVTVELQAKKEVMRACEIMNYFFNKPVEDGFGKIAQQSQEAMSG